MISVPPQTPAGHTLRGASAPHWYLAALTFCALFWLLAWYGDTVYSLIDIWYRSDTFAHGFLIVPISAWLIWRRREEIGAISPQPNLWMLVPLVFLGFIWLLSALASVVVVQQYCLVLMIPLLVATILGTRMVAALTFPFLFLLFAVPFGEIFLPQLIEHTADFTVFALRLTGIPVYREGNFFSLPSGNWSVVEACSGLRYLIASLTLGCLYAYLTYRSPKRRALFIGLSIVVPIVANWLRAYMIVMIGHLSSMKLAVGVDHLIYGWLFFGVVMLALFWAGSFWREDDIARTTTKRVMTQKPLHSSKWPLMLSATALSAIAVAAPRIGLSHFEGKAGYPVTLRAPAGIDGWVEKAGTLSDWAPHFLGSRARIRQLYSRGGDNVELYIGYYRNQHKNAVLITSLNMLALRNDHVWGSIAEADRTPRIGDETINVTETVLRNQQNQLLVWHWYWVDGKFTASPVWAKFLQAKSQMLGRGDDAAVIILFTDTAGAADHAANRLLGFAGAVLPQIRKQLQAAELDDHATQRRR